MHKVAEAVMFIPTTPSSELKNIIHDILTRKTVMLGMKATVKERRNQDQGLLKSITL